MEQDGNEVDVTSQEVEQYGNEEDEMDATSQEVEHDGSN